MTDHVNERPDNDEHGFGVWEPFVPEPIPGEYDRTTIPEKPEALDADKRPDGPAEDHRESHS